MNIVHVVRQFYPAVGGFESVAVEPSPSSSQVFKRHIALIERSGDPVFIRRVLGRWFSGAKVYREVDDLDNKDWMVVRTE